VPLVLSLTVGLGVLLIYLSLTSRPDEAGKVERQPGAARLEEFLRQAGVEGVGTPLPPLSWPWAGRW
jgi:hypothetical protein